MLVNDLANKIRSLSLDGAPLDADGNQIVRVAFIESDLPEGILIMAPLSGLLTPPEMPGWLVGNIQVIVRHIDPMAGYDLAKEISDALTVRGDPLDLDNYRLACFYPFTDPITYPVNEAGLIENSVTFDCRAFRI